MKTTYHIREKGWLNFVPVYIGYNTEDEEDYIFFPRHFDRVSHAWWRLWEKLFAKDLIFLAGPMKCFVIVSINEDGDVCGLEL